ncbi:DUF4159 domain-containing protein [Pseudochelatococcus sp. B33]
MPGLTLFGTPLAFAAPLVLLALAALPVLWVLLRVTPPAPRQIAFPPLRLALDLVPKRQTPARTPWWLLLLRLLVAALVILACAWPAWNPLPVTPGGGPVLLLIDNGFSAANDWSERQESARETLEGAARGNRPAAVVGLAEAPADIAPTGAIEATERLRALQPLSHAAARSAHLPAIERFLGQYPDAAIVWITDRTTLRTAEADAPAQNDDFAARLQAQAGERALVVRANPSPEGLTLADTANTREGMTVQVGRADSRGPAEGRLRATDLRGLTLGEAAFAFAPDALEAEARFELPVEIRNNIARIDVVGQNSAGAVALVDGRQRRHRVGLVSGAGADTASQPLLAPTFYLARALEPYAELREPRGAVPDAVARLIDENATVIALTDIGVIDAQTADRLEEFVERGGILLRFSGPRMANSDEVLVPVRLRQGERTIGGALSWDTPRTLAPFPEMSPFHGLAISDEVTVSRQILAEPDADLTRRTWAALTDGTPVITADRRGEGLIVLVHVTADATWSNLPLSGTFVEILRRIIALSEAAGPTGEGEAAAAAETVSPQRTLDGFGAFRSPPPTARPVARSALIRASIDHPAGFYGSNEAPTAVNVLGPGDRPAPLDVAAVADAVQPLTSPQNIDLRRPLLLVALLLFMLDTGISALSGRGRGRRRRSAAGVGQAGLAASVVFLALAPAPAPAQTSASLPSAQPLPQISDVDRQAALQTRLAYVITGNDEVDEASRAGLTGLSQELSYRTSFEPGDPVGVDPATDELAFYPLIYWPVVADRPLPSNAALRRIDAFMKSGGTVVFDTRDAWLQGAATQGAPTPETVRLRQMLAGLDIPELEPVPADHVLTKTFFLMDHFPGRYATGETWVEALPPVPEGEPRPVRSGDNVSPIIITSNDLAAAWASDDFGNPLFPTVGSDPDQHEMAARGGMNMVMYVLTGSYKADQVHVPALLDRLGQ